MNICIRLFILLAAPLAAHLASASDFRMNCCDVKDAPSWATSDRLRSIDARISEALAWSIRRIRVQFYAHASHFKQASNLRFSVNAFFRPSDESVHVSPSVTEDMFDATFGHELVHVIFHQKYKNAIPAWLEEGLANFIGSRRAIDYNWLAKQKLTPVTSLVHPNSDASGSKYHYQASGAAAAMIADRCNMNDLLMLSVGRKLEKYLATFCKIEDVDVSFRDWVQRNAGKIMPTFR